jgi:hypothetical protein
MTPHGGDREPPSFATGDLGEELTRAGSPAAQRGLRSVAWLMLDTYCTPSGLMGSRLSEDWLSSRGWAVQLVPH